MTGLVPGPGPVSGNPVPLSGHTTRLRLVGECFLLLVLKDLTLGGLVVRSGFSDNIGHIPV